MSIFCRPATADEIAPLHQIIKRCGEDIFQRFGLCHWHPPFPIETLRKNAMEGAVHAVADDGKLIGTLTASTGGWKHTHDLWLCPAPGALYLGKLAILPERQNQGLGAWCMKQVEEMAREKGCGAVRFNAITAHTRLIQFYERLGYGTRGALWIKDWRGVSREITLFEKEIPLFASAAEAAPERREAALAAPRPQASVLRQRRSSQRMSVAKALRARQVTTGK